MRSNAPELLPIFRSRHQADILAKLLLHPDREFTVTELSSALRIPQSTVSGEVRRLSDAGIFSVNAIGRSRLVRANPGSVLVPPLTELLTLTFGPHVVIADEFGQLADAEQVLIFGSWAARYHGRRGRPPNDVDVLVVGSPDRTAMQLAAESAERRLDRQVNPVVCSLARWADTTDPFIEEIKASPFLTVIARDPAGESM